MTPGSFLLGNAGECFECGHEHAAGDRCVAFRSAPDWFDGVAADAGATRGKRRFRVSRLPPVRELSALVARAAAGVVASSDVAWEELAIQVAAAAIRVAGGVRHDGPKGPAGALARVTAGGRALESDPPPRRAPPPLARDAGFGPFHHLR